MMDGETSREQEMEHELTVEEMAEELEERGWSLSICKWSGGKSTRAEWQFDAATHEFRLDENLMSVGEYVSGEPAVIDSAAEHEVVFRLDLDERTAEYEPGGDESVELEFGSGYEAGIRYVGHISEVLDEVLAGEVGANGHGYTLMRANEDWSCALYSVDQGEYFVRYIDGMLGHDGDETYYRVDYLAEERILEADSEEEAEREMMAVRATATGEHTDELQEEKERWTA